FFFRPCPMSERRTISLPKAPPATDDDQAQARQRRQPVRPHAPVQRSRVRQEPAPASEQAPPAPRAERPAPPRQAERAERPPRQDVRQPPAPREHGRTQPVSPTSSRQAPEDGRVRLSKLMSEQGLSSRREADD